MKKIIIIDQGVDTTHVRLATANITGVTIRKRRHTYEIEEGVFDDLTGHGTAIAAIIHRLAPAMELYALKLTTERGTITEDLLVKGLEWCRSVPDVCLINISLGIADNNPSAALYEACHHLHVAGIHIVAAIHNFPGVDCYPAYFPFVYGVGCGLTKNKTDFNYLGEGKINILAKGTMQRVAWKNNEFLITAGTSFAAAHVSGILGELLFRNPHANINTYLQQHANAEVQELSYLKKDDALRSVELTAQELDVKGNDLFTTALTAQMRTFAVFPSSEKEISTLLAFPDQVNGTIALAIDYPRTLASVRQTQQERTVIRRGLTAEEYLLFDTLVVGYYLEVPVDTNILFGNRLLIDCIKQNKHFIVLDNEVYGHLKKLIGQHYPHYNGTVILPAVNKEMLRDTLRFQYLPQVSKPVLALIGTGSKQGKITTQLRLRQVLQRAGYKVSLVSTEPQGIVLGASYIFPFGYKGTVTVNMTHWNKILGAAMKGVQHYNQPDLILTGIQGAILPRVINDTRDGSGLTALQYLTGIKPDAVICAINPMDPVEFIQQTIQTVYNFTHATTLLCVMTPWVTTIAANAVHAYSKMELLDADEMKTRMETYAAALKLPVINIMDTNNDALILEVIQNFFSHE